MENKIPDLAEVVLKEQSLSFSKDTLFKGECEWRILRPEAILDLIFMSMEFIHRNKDFELNCNLIIKYGLLSYIQLDVNEVSATAHDPFARSIIDMYAKNLGIFRDKYKKWVHEQYVLQTHQFSFYIEQAKNMVIYLKSQQHKMDCKSFRNLMRGEIEVVLENVLTAITIFNYHKKPIKT
jgi:hypothetical protein